MAAKKKQKKRIDSRAKGKRGELDYRDYLRTRWRCPEAIRGRQYQGGSDSPDVRFGIPGTLVEVKFTGRLQLHPAVLQAKMEAGEGEVPYVAYRRNRSPWYVILEADDVPAFVERFYEHYFRSGETDN